MTDRPPKNLKDWLRRNGITQSEIARDLNVSPPLVWSTISGYERNRRVIRWLQEHGCAHELLERLGGRVMPKEYSFEVREQAEDLYVVQGLTYEKVSEITKVSVNQLQRWGKDGGWRKVRDERRERTRNIQLGLEQLLAEKIDHARFTKDAQDTYAVSKLKTAMQIQEVLRLKPLLENLGSRLEAIANKLDKIIERLEGEGA